MKLRTLGIAFSCLAGLIGGQASTSQIKGEVRDSSGLAVPGAALKLTQIGPGATRLGSVRGEAFNFPNWVNLGPAATPNSGSFGLIQSAGDPRMVQLR